MKSLTHYTKGTPSPFRAPTACRHPVSGTVSLPSSGCFSPFPHGTCSLSVVEEYLGLEGGPPMFRQDFTCPALLEDICFSTRTGLSPAKADFSKSFRFFTYITGLFPFRSPLLGESLLMSFPPGTEMFHFPGFALCALCIQATIIPYETGVPFPSLFPNTKMELRSRNWVSPFGYPRIKVCLQLPAAFRSMPRPSSPLNAKASTECPFETLDRS